MLCSSLKVKKWTDMTNDACSTQSWQHWSENNGHGRAVSYVHVEFLPLPELHALMALVHMFRQITATLYLIRHCHLRWSVVSVYFIHICMQIVLFCPIQLRIKPHHPIRFSHYNGSTGIKHHLVTDLCHCSPIRACLLWMNNMKYVKACTYDLKIYFQKQGIVTLSVYVCKA